MEEWRYSSTILNLGTRGEWSDSRLGRFTPWEIVPGTHWIGGWVGPRAGLDAMEKRKISFPCWESNPGSHPAYRAVTIPTELSRLANKRNAVERLWETDEGYS
jgi:hypothetical protein